MALYIQLPAETEAKLREQATAAGKELDRYVVEVVEEKLASSSGSTSGSGELTPEQWSAEWHAWAASHRKLNHTVDDSRESIYAGHGQ